ncbi:NAD(P)-binding protein [Auriculariales sp. MPI-PUGE-AT-0066]|nr:NAD(P)-binding protein [Auriculariales sp. MPI-PUGE-AT-0066]
MSLRVLKRTHVSEAISHLTLDDLLENQAAVFRSLSIGTNVQCPPRLTLALPNHTTLIMPGRILGTGSALKVVSVPRGGDAPPGLPAATAVIDEQTGRVRALINASELTALRTAAGSVLATRLLLGREAQPTHIVAFGSGAQIRAHLDLLVQAYPNISHISIINRTVNQRVNSLRAHIAESVLYAQSGNRVEIVVIASSETTSVAAAVSGANVIICATSSTAPLFQSEWVRLGTHIVLVGSYTPAMHEAPEELIRRAGIVVVDSREACAEEAGELINAGFTAETARWAHMVEVGELAGESKWTAETVRAAGDVTIFKSVGIAAQDVAIACAVVDRAEQLNIGPVIDFDA